MTRTAVVADKLVDAIRSAGTIRTAELAKITGVAANYIGTALAPAIAARRVIMCKVSIPGQKGGPINEYRIGSGIPDTFKPLAPKKNGALGIAAHHSAGAGHAPLSTPKPDVTQIEPATLVHQPQPAVGQNTGSTRSDSSFDPPEARAVAAAGRTPKSEPKRRGMGPASGRPSAGDVIRIQLDDDGTLLIATGEAIIELDPKQTRKLGHFLGATHGAWNPF